MKGELLEQQKQHQQIINIENWTDAILIFTSIYCSAHPATYPDMLKYIHTSVVKAGKIIANNLG